MTVEFKLYLNKWQQITGHVEEEDMGKAAAIPESISMLLKSESSLITPKDVF